MIYIVIIWIIALLIGGLLTLFGVDMKSGVLLGLGIEAILFMIMIYIYSSTHWGIVRSRAWNMAELHKKRIMRENLETWNRYNRNFIRECEREDHKKDEKEWNRTSYLGYDPMDGAGWKYCDDD